MSSWLGLGRCDLGWNSVQYQGENEVLEEVSFFSQRASKHARNNEMMVVLVERT